MSILLPTLAVTFAAFCVWLTVRIVGRRERWAKWTLGSIAVVLVLYPLSLPPISLILTKIGGPYWGASAFQLFYAPILWIYDDGSDQIHEVMNWYFHLWFD